MYLYLTLLIALFSCVSCVQSMDNSSFEALDVVIQEKQNISPQEQFFNAARTGDIDTIQQLLIAHSQEIDINAIDATTGYTAFMHAAFNKHVPVMQLLLDHDYDLHVRNKENIPGYYYLFWFNEFVPYVQPELAFVPELIQNEGKELLQHAVQKGALEHVKVLVHQYGVNPNEFDKIGFTALHAAAAYNQLAIMRYFIEKCKVNSLIPSQKELRSPLHSAALNGSREVFDYLSARVSAQSILIVEHRHGTVLHNAIVGNKLDMVDYLATNYPALLTIRNKYNNSPLGIAVHYNKEDIVKLLIEKYKLNAHEDRYYMLPISNVVVPGAVSIGLPLLHVAASGGYLNLVKYFVEELHLDPLQEEQTYAPAVNQAAANGKLDVLKYFLENCDINQESKAKFSGETLLHAAVIYGYYPEVLDYLIKQRKCNVNITNTSNRTPLMTAVFFNRLPVVRYLLEVAKANLQLKDIAGKTIVHFAYQHMPILNYLLNEHYPAIDINAVDNNSDTAIHQLIRNNQNANAAALKKLLQAGANSFLRNKQNMVPLQYPVNNTLREIISKFFTYTPQLFEAYDKKSRVKLQYLALNITFNIQDEHGDTLLHKAIRENNTDMITFLLTINREVAGIKNKQGETPITLALLHHRPMFDLLWKVACIAKLNATTNPRKRSIDIMESTSTIQ